MRPVADRDLRHVVSWRRRTGDRRASGPARRRGGEDAYLMPTMMIVKEPGIAAPRPPPRPPAGGVVPAGGGGGGGPVPDAIANRWPVLLSNAIVRAPFEGQVFRFCSTSKLVALFSLTM